MAEQQDKSHSVDEAWSAGMQAWPAGRQVWFVAAEATPFIKVGGLADVAGELPKALLQLGVKITLCLPLHGGMKLPDVALSNMSMPDMSIPDMSMPDMPMPDMPVPGMSWPVKLLDIGGSKRNQNACIMSGSQAHQNVRMHDTGSCMVRAWNADGLPVRAYEIPGFFGREDVYAYSDDSERFAAFCLAVAADAETETNPPDILHLNDWHTASLAMLCHHAPESGDGAKLRQIRTLLTIHSLEYQGRGQPSLADFYGMGPTVMGEDGAAFEDGFNAMKAGIAWADAITTVSPAYAEEILKHGNGFGLESFLACRVKAMKRIRYAGILNRLDESWNPATDEALDARYDAKSTEKRKYNKTILQKELGLKETTEPLAVYIGRLVAGKGIGLLLDAAEGWLQSGMQLAILGTGELMFQDRIRGLSEKYPCSMTCRFIYDESLARRMYAAADMLLMPSRREACGLSQQIAMRYGCLPVVRKTGGLKDTVTDGKNGFVFIAETAAAMNRAVRRACRLFRGEGAEGEWRSMMQAAMRTDSRWARSARAYLRLYLDLLDMR